MKTPVACKPRPTTLLKKRLWHRCFPVNLAKFLKTRVLQNTSGRLLLKTSKKAKKDININSILVKMLTNIVPRAI